MGNFCEFKKATQDKTIFINSAHVIMICAGDAQGTTKIELAGQRTFDVSGTVEMTKALLEQVVARRQPSVSDDGSRTGLDSRGAANPHGVHEPHAKPLHST